MIISELVDLRDNKKPITNEEFKKAKEYLKGHLVLELEDSRSVAIYHATQVSFGKGNSYTRGGFKSD